MSRSITSSYRFTNPIFVFSRTQFSSSSADQYWAQLQKNGSNVERNLNMIRAQLDTSSVTQVLQRCVNQPVLGLRFFIWAALQPNYRHTTYMYNKVCNLLKIKLNPCVINDVMEDFGSEGCLGSVKRFKVVLNLCREAKLANEALWVLRKMEEGGCRPDTLAYNVVIRLFCDKGDMDEADRLMREMKGFGLYPDMITYVAMTKGFVEGDRLEEACGLFKVMESHGCLPNTVMYSTLLDGVCRFGSLDKALQLLGEMEKEGGASKPNVITYTSVIQSYCENGKSLEALSILDRMVANGSVPNRVTASTLINGLCLEGHVNEVYKLICRFVGEGFVSDTECYSALVVSLMRVEKIPEAEKVFRKMLATSVSPNSLASSLLIKKLCSKGQILDGYRLYVEIEKLGCILTIDSDIYSILLAGLCQDGHLLEAANLAGVMVEKGIGLKPPYAEIAIDHLKNLGELELVSHILRLQNRS
ncbi:hypothetical protein DCAR_0830708 [Daucus carota subsp. sativus]|uniref:Pentacotripeptide-repeat region of PRORP domain-containing protein n=1 Tax=Daucus carota subsp. sativus TaxID=79200 RepID=A0AAF1BAZ1_DAUCS|nr:hypothetical protein DCAR_0830708 [Daucus carota subsp. sativus]